MVNIQKAEEIAVNRHKVIAPIVAAMEESVDAAKIVLLKKEACRQAGIHRRTLGRWIDAHKLKGFYGLKPQRNNMPPRKASLKN